MLQIVLTRDEAERLRAYLASESGCRGRGIAAALRLSGEKNADGSPRFPKMLGNARLLIEEDEFIDGLIGKLGGAGGYFSEGGGGNAKGF